MVVADQAQPQPHLDFGFQRKVPLLDATCWTRLEPGRHSLDQELTLDLGPHEWNLAESWRTAGHDGPWVALTGLVPDEEP